MKIRPWRQPDLGRSSFAHQKTQAFSLIEVVLALGIITFSFLILIALISLGLNSNRLAHEQIIALNLCRQIESDLKATPSTNSVSPLYAIAVPSVGVTNTTVLYDSYSSSTTSFGSVATNSQYRFTITLTGPPTTSPNDPVNAQIQATWPAQVVPLAASATSNPTNVVGTVNLDVAITRFGS